MATLAQAVDKFAEAVGKLHASVYAGTPRSAFAASSMFNSRSANGGFMAGAVSQNLDFNKEFQRGAVRDAVREVVARGGDPFKKVGEAMDRVARELNSTLLGTSRDRYGGQLDTGPRLMRGTESPLQRTLYLHRLAQERLTSRAADAGDLEEIAFRHKKFGFKDERRYIGNGKYVDKTVSVPVHMSEEMARRMADAAGRMSDELKRLTAEVVPRMSGTRQAKMDDVIKNATQTSEELNAITGRITKTLAPFGGELADVEKKAASLKQALAELESQNRLAGDAIHMPGATASRSRQMWAKARVWLGLDPSGEPKKSLAARLSGRLDATGPAAAGVLGASGYALSQGAPVQFATLKGSAGLLAASLGQGLTGTADWASGRLQGAADWFHRHTTTRDTVAVTAATAASAVVLGQALRSVAPLVTMVGSAAKVAIAGLLSISGRGWAGIGIAGAGATAVTAGIAHGYGQFTEGVGRLNDMRDDQAVTSNRIRSGNMTWQELANANGDYEGLRQQYDQAMKETQKTTYPHATGGWNPYENGKMLVRSLFGDLKNDAGAGMEAQKKADEIEKKMDAVYALAKGKKLNIDTGIVAPPVGTDGRVSKAMNDQLLRSFGSLRAPVVTGDIGDAWSAIQIRALEQDPLHQKELEYQVESLGKLRENVEATKSVERAVRETRGVTYKP
jgi:hypothetical protein